MPVPKKCTCTGCPFHADRGEVPYEGPAQTDILIVGESPGAEENKIGRPFSGISGRFLMALLRHIGKERGDVLLTNSCRCTIYKDKDTIKNQNLALRTCRHKLAAVINRVQPRIIVALGGVALKQLTGLQKIMENRGKFFDSTEFNTKIFATVHPAWILRQGARDGFWDQPIEKMSATERLMFMDFEQVQKYLGDPSKAGLDTTQYVRGTKKAQVEELKKAEVLAIDFETTGLDLENPNTRILSIGFSAEEGKSIVFLPKRDGTFPQPVLDLLADPNITKIVAARPFEERCARKLGVEMPGDTVHDVLSMAHVLDENFSGGYSLEKVADLYTGLKNIKSLAQGQRGSLESVSKKTLVEYNGVDCDATLRAFHVMRRMLGKDPVLAHYYTHFTQKMQAMFADLHYNGCLVDTEALGSGERELEEIARASEQEALRMIPDAITTDEKHVGKLRLSRDSLVREYLFTHPAGKKLKPNEKYLTPKKKEPQITEDHLKQFSGPFIENYLRHKKAKKILSTYLKKLWTQMHPDGRVYPDTIFTRTVTGRTVMVNPAIQTIPQRGDFAKHVKKAFVADKGWIIGARDLSQSEIRIVGWLAQDPNILGALAANVDVHTKTAAIINRVPVEQVTKDMRQKAKACIAEGQLVSAKNLFTGAEYFVPIQRVSTSEAVWDGVEWVQHDGVIYQGEREVFTYGNLTATADHTVFLEGGGSCDFSQAAAENLKLAHGDAAFNRFGYLGSDGDVDNSRETPQSPSPLPCVWKDGAAVGRQRSLWPHEELQMSKGTKVCGGSEGSSSRGPLRRYFAKDYESAVKILAQLRGQGNPVALQVENSLHYVVLATSPAPDVQGSSDRPAGQQRALRSGESEAGFTTNESYKQAYERESSLQGDFGERQPPVASDQDFVPMVPVRERVDQQAGEEGTLRGGDPAVGQGAQGRKVCRVYDIRNAGPRHRFTVQGKIVSNCTARGEHVLTDRGPIPIENVTVDMKIWDGVEWVRHCGVIYKGEREVIEYEGLKATADHIVLTEDGREIPFGEAASSMDKPHLAVGAVEGTPVGFALDNRYGDSGKPPEDTLRLFQMSERANPAGGQPSVEEDDHLPVPKVVEVRRRPEGEGSRGQVRCDQAALHEPELGHVEELRREGDSNAVLGSGTLHPVGTEEPATPNVQRSADRSSRQRRMVPSGESQIIHSSGKSEEYQNEPLAPVQWYTGAPGTRVASAEDGLPPIQPVEGVREDYVVHGNDRGAGTLVPKKEISSVYDLVNCGPRHRYVVSSGLICRQCNFGFIYGMSAKKFQSYAKDEYGINLTIEQCEAVRVAFFAHPSGYYRLLDFHRKQEQEAITRGYVRSPIGRIRRLPNAQQSKDRMAMGEALRQGINFPVQSFSSDLGLVGMYLFWKWVKKNGHSDKVKIMWFIHDAVVFQAKADFMPEAMRALKWCMEKGAVKYMKKHFNLDVGYPVASDGKTGRSWDSLKEFCDTCGAGKLVGSCPKCRAEQEKADAAALKKAREEAALAGRTRIKRTLVIN